MHEATRQHLNPRSQRLMGTDAAGVSKIKAIAGHRRDIARVPKR